MRNHIQIILKKDRKIIREQNLILDKYDNKAISILEMVYI